MRRWLKEKFKRAKERIGAGWRWVKSRIRWLLLGGVATTAMLSLLPSGTQPLTDYKFWYIKRDLQTGMVREVAVRFYEGAILPAEETIVSLDATTSEPTLGAVAVERYQRTKRLQREELAYLGGVDFVKEASGRDAAFYTQEDFGTIYADDEIRWFLNGELAKDGSRESIMEQRERAPPLSSLKKTLSRLSGGSALAADTGSKTAGSASNVTGWTNFTVAQLNSSNDARATTVNTSATPADGRLSQFSFGVPGGVIIDGIEIQVEFSNDTASKVSTIRLSLSYDNGTNFTATKQDTVTGTTDTTKTFGGSADTWGRTWNYQELANPNFVLKVEGWRQGGAGNTVRVDFVQAKVYYHLPPGTTYTFYPDADPETTTVDGSVAHELGATWAAARDGAGNAAYPSVTAGVFSGSVKWSASNWEVDKGFTLFDTSSIPDGDTISSATMSYYQHTAGNNVNTDGDTAHVVSAAPASNTNLVAGDFTTAGSASYGSLAFASWTNDAYNDISLNASGIAAISKTGVTKFALRSQRDIDNSAPTGVNWRYGAFAETAGTSQDPKLVVTASSERRILIID